MIFDRWFLLAALCVGYLVGQLAGVAYVYLACYGISLAMRRLASEFGQDGSTNGRSET